MFVFTVGRDIQVTGDRLKATMEKLVRGFLKFVFSLRVAGTTGTDVNASAGLSRHGCQLPLVA